ncbi:hypothetical protein SAMN04488061_2859 [Filomicrobium insigne]|uniref:YHS domain-containing protein n=1 Tax=Filomicrobium insigne TaxID=418854 RepID=A0A1H0SEA8_9HYPH|nr:hypothetical protein SAMN04488061_2859 [Filomicrobium insigne]
MTAVCETCGSDLTTGRSWRLVLTCEAVPHSDGRMPTAPSLGSEVYFCAMPCLEGWVRMRRQVRERNRG